ncbi:MAG TPA: glucosyl-3-phosphoglycerate synthase [Acidimicrobiales bacterium]|nr:glucosyl-3-phosphoglycerate synthase [Acidimicrobiales bacterium]
MATPAELVAAKGACTIAVCIPARNEAGTVAAIVASVRRLSHVGLVDEIVVVDDGSSDATASRASAAGATVLPSVTGPGKGQAMSAAVAATDSDVVVFLDADVANFSERFVTALVAPILSFPEVQLVKASYRRPLYGQPGEGGRVTELVARPLLERFFPELAQLGQPLAGECAVRRSALAGLTLDDGYGVDIGLLIDVYRQWGMEAITEVDLVERIHRNRPLADLRRQATAVLDAVLVRATDPR